MPVKMLTIVCREQFEDQVLEVFSNLKISGYTVVHGVGGSGETGAVSVTHPSYEHNKLILVALDDERMDILVKGVKQLLVRLVEERFGDPVPLKAFVQPCEPVLLLPKERLQEEVRAVETNQPSRPRGNEQARSEHLIT
jgi:nitrogen regulatory protein PII